jgi:hypothetical protein
VRPCSERREACPVRRNGAALGAITAAALGRAVAAMLPQAEGAELSSLRVLKVALISAVLVAPVSAAAQTPSERVKAALQPSPAETQIQLKANGTLATGAFLGYQGTELLLRESNAVMRIQLSEIDSLWVRSSMASEGAKQAGVIGFVIGGALGGLFVASLCETESGCASDYAIAIPIGGALFALPSALLGAAAGSGKKIWKLRYHNSRTPTR